MPIHPDIMFIAAAAADGVAIDLYGVPITKAQITRAQVAAVLEHLADCKLITIATDEEVTAAYQGDGDMPPGLPLRPARHDEIVAAAKAEGARLQNAIAAELQKQGGA